jgi:D-arginine dehydrogenase
MTDIVIVGAGMAGASLAAALAGAAEVILLEAESRPGYHATGRSAAFWSESYGGPLVRPLTSASGPFLVEHGLTRRRGAIHLADASGAAALDALAAAFPDLLEPLDRAALEAAIPGLKPGWERGLAEPSCADIDVAALHALYLRGAAMVTGARLLRAERAGRWRLETSAGVFIADVLVNAAGAWADEVAALAGEAPIGIRPCRRTIAQLRIEPPAPADLPLVIDAAGRFYFKPEAGGRLWLSPNDETPSFPCDCAPEEIDVALAIDRLAQAVDWRIDAVERKWAGLRSFAPDRLPVYGFSGSGRGFFWCAGQGGFGIQTAPAAARLAADLLLGCPPEIDPAPYSAARFA